MRRGLPQSFWDLWLFFFPQFLVPEKEEMNEGNKSPCLVIKSLAINEKTNAQSWKSLSSSHTFSYAPKRNINRQKYLWVLSPKSPVPMNPPAKAQILKYYCLKPSGIFFISTWFIGHWDILHNKQSRTFPCTSHPLKNGITLEPKIFTRDPLWMVIMWSDSKSLGIKNLRLVYAEMVFI